MIQGNLNVAIYPNGQVDIGVHVTYNTKEQLDKAYMLQRFLNDSARTLTARLEPEKPNEALRQQLLKL